jgi:4-cresol dehydrogenase (hydroxylating)
MSVDKINKFVSQLVELGLLQSEIFTGDRCAAYNQSTYPSANQNILAIRPAPEADTGEARYSKILSIINTAKRHCVHLYPISKGKNWGYGSNLPNKNGAVLVDLSLFDKISGYDIPTHQITVEPGVTQQHLYEYLQSKGEQHWMDATGGPIDSSILGNTLERGFGHTLNAEHAKNIIHLNVAIPWGENKSASINSSGLLGSWNASSGKPRVVALGGEHHLSFVQSNLGIVLNMTIRLMPKPEDFCAFFIDIKEQKFNDFIKLAHELKQCNIIQSASHIGNKHKAVEMVLKQDYRNKLGSKQRLSKEILEDICKHYGLADWTASGGFYGTKLQVAANRKELSKRIATLGLKAIYIDDFRLRAAMKLKHFMANTKYGRILRLLLSRLGLGVRLNKLELLDDLHALYNLKKGIPTNHFIRTIYVLSRDSEKNIGNNLNPDRDKIGLLWLAPCSEVSPEAANFLVDIMKTNCETYGIEPAISLTLLNGHTMECVLSITFDAYEDKDTQRAINCHQRILFQATQKGYMPYRLSTISASQDLSQYAKQTFQPLSLKHYCDPLNIISPGRYVNTVSDNLTQ